MSAETSNDTLWQATYDTRQQYFERAVGPLPQDILKMLNMTGVWPGGGLFVIPALKISELLTVYTTFGFTNPDMPATTSMADFQLQHDGQRPTQAKGSLQKKDPAPKRLGAAGYGYEICVVAEPNQQWPLGFLQWAVNAEIGKDVGLLARVEEYGGLTVGELHVAPDKPINVLIAKARAPWPAGAQLPNGKMELLIATTITDEELQWSLENGREALLKKLEDAHVGQISLPGRESVVGKLTSHKASPLPKKILGDRAQDLMRDMVAILFQGFVVSMEGKPWKEGFADIRRPENGSTVVSKAQVVLPDGSLKSPSRDAVDLTEVRNRFEELWDTRDTESPHVWYGLKIAVHPDGKCQIEFNYDPDCASDRTFFES
jgi:hypothetical protein